MTISFARHQFPPAIIQHTVWLYVRFTLSYHDVEDLLAERGLDISYETVRRWVLKFGPRFEVSLPMPQPLDGSGEVVGRELTVALICVPDTVDRLSEILPQLSASRSRFGSVVRQGEIQFQNLCGESLDRDILARIDAVRGPYEKAEDQGRHGSPASGPMHPADAKPPHCGSSALQPAPLRFGAASQRLVHIQEHGVDLLIFGPPPPPGPER
jgi:hypothetical protein